MYLFFRTEDRNGAKTVFISCKLKLFFFSNQNNFSNYKIDFNFNDQCSHHIETSLQINWRDSVWWEQWSLKD